MSWLYGRPVESTLDYIQEKFGKRPELAEANSRAFKAGVNYGETSEDFVVSYEVKPAKMPPGRLPADHRQPGALARPRRRQRAEQAAALPRRVPDHAGLVDPRGARALQAVRDPDVPGRGRDRCSRRGARRLVRRRARRLHVGRARASSSRRRRSGSASCSSCRSSSSTSSGQARRPGCRRSRSRPIC